MFDTLSRKENDKLFDILISGQKHTLRLANFCCDNHVSAKFNELIEVSDEIHDVLSILEKAYQIAA